MTWYPKTYNSTVTVSDLVVTDDLTTADAVVDDGGVLIAGFMPAAVQQALTGAGAANLTTFYTAMTNNGANAVTLADGIKGQLKKLKMVADPGTDTTVTFNGTATIVFADVGDYAVLMFDGADWVPVELGNDADGTTAPAYTPAA